ncbi:MAG: RNA pyrophosphohydrolase [Leptospira sp.]|nr:RNA pyrophosphohydrolase [Leptospira sp.]
MTEKPYRKNVGMVVFNSQGEVIVGERVHFPNSWQFPQGGIDEKEDYIDAAKRELYEELGIKDAVYVGEYPDWIPYDFPNNLHLNANLQKYRGQLQRWILYYWDGALSDCDLTHHEIEFLSIRFMRLEETVEAVVDFKKPVYQKFVPFFSNLVQNYIAHNVK